MVSTGDSIDMAHDRGKVAWMGEETTDQDLVERVQAGDKRAFDLLVLKYQNRIIKLISRFVHDPMEAQDVAQEAFIRLYRRGALPDDAGSWLVVVLSWFFSERTPG